MTNSRPSLDVPQPTSSTTAPPSPNFATVLSRRTFCGASAQVALGAALVSSTTAQANPNTPWAWDFEQVAANSLDTITLPNDYLWYPLIRWGDPLFAEEPAFDHTTRGSAANQMRAFGDNCDGMWLFNSEGISLLAVNNEYVNLNLMFPSGLPQTDDDIRKNMVAHGVSIVQITAVNGTWQAVTNSAYNRRITPLTPMQFTGPVRGHKLVQTDADPEGTRPVGTWNNCANGKTPWGTYLTCEENFNGYFSSSDPNHQTTFEESRYGIAHDDWGNGWRKVEHRFDISKHPNEPNRVGYVVEIDPFDPQSTPKKHSALGRFKHENAELVINTDGRLVVYMGDDERGEYLYKFVSKQSYTPGTNGSHLLEDGTLYVAKFDANQRGSWLPLTPETTEGMSKAEIAMFTRIAASKVQATTMDRPEWIAANSDNADVYCCLTNNKNRGIKPNAGNDPTPVGGPNPRAKNIYGQIIRFTPHNGDHAGDDFSWNIYAMAGNPVVHPQGPMAGSPNITKDNMFNSPDGISWSPSGKLWIQTDGTYSNKDDFAHMGNNQMLVGNPTTGEIRRFMVGPRECEITGLTWSDDTTTLFVGIQHPGEESQSDAVTSHFPEGGDALPRSTVIAIQRKDGKAFV